MADRKTYAPTKSMSSASVNGSGGGHRAALALFAVGIFLVCMSLYKQGSHSSGDRPAAREASTTPRETFQSGASREAAVFRRHMQDRLLEAQVKQEALKVEAQLTAARARPVISDRKPEPVPDVVTIGVPLKPQLYFLSERQLDRKRDDVVRDATEARIRGMVKNDRDAEALDIQTQKVFIAEFIANARRAGWRAQVDKDLNVVYESLAADMQQPGQANRRPQAVSPTLRNPVFAIRLFAPYCPALK